MFLWLHLFVIYNIIIWKPCVSVYYNGSEKRIKGKLIKLVEEIVLDATSKVKSIQHFRHSGIAVSKQFEYGTIMYEIRYRRANMFRRFANTRSFLETHPMKEPITEDYEKLNEKYAVCIDAVVDVDNMAHEVDNFIAMIHRHEANTHGDKSKVGWDLHFRRTNMAPEWLRLVDIANKDSNDLPEQVVKAPEQDNQTHTGKRKNGVWHQAVPKE